VIVRTMREPRRLPRVFDDFVPVPQCRLDLLVSKIGYRAKAKCHRIRKLRKAYRNQFSASTDSQLN
jgi:hypothetical protein